MPDEILLPQVPEAKPDDPEDVSWALSTADAMWARGEHLEGIKWVRRAAEAASEAEDDMRALELAKAAADLTGLISRMSKASPDEASAPNAPPPPRSAPPPPVRSAPPPPVRSSPPPAVRSAPPPPLAPTPAVPNVAPAAASVTRQVATPSRPPVAPLTNKQQAPRPLAVAPRGASPSTPSKAPPAPGSAPKDSRGSAPRPPAPPPVPTADRPSMNASATDTSPLPAQPAPYPIFPRRADSDATVIAHVSELDGELHANAMRSTDDFGDTTNPGSEDSPVTANGFSSDEADTDRKTRLGSAPPPRAYAPDESLLAAGTGVAGGMPAASAAPAGSRTPAVRQDPPHDPNLLTSQAVRVVVWRDASGVHVAPAGTVVSAIKVDAVLVALEPNADLTAWLSQRSR